MKKVLIIGGVAGGASAAARLRRLDEDVQIILFERGEYISYANCGLPYYIGGVITDHDLLTLQTPGSFNARFNVDVRVFNEVIAINRAVKSVTVKNHKTGEMYEESYDKLILSPGAEPIKPGINGVESDKVFTLRNIPDMDKIKSFIDVNKPKSAAIIGGGYIGVEMAENLHHAGLDVTLIEMQDQIIAPLDYDMAAIVQKYIKGKDVSIILQNGVKSIIDNGNCLTVALGEGEVHADMLIMSIGVRPESGLAKDAGLELNERGAIVVNDNMLTSDHNIYAIGDAAEASDFITSEKVFVPLAGPANKQGRIAADNICDIDSKYVKTQGSAILKVFDMTVATTGINEKAAKRLGLDYEKSFTFSANHAGYYPSPNHMTIKTIFEKQTGRLLGVQIVGFDGVDKRCDVFAAAIRAGMTAFELTELELCYAPPYSSAKDPVNMAGYVIENLLTGEAKSFHWHDIADLQKRNDVTLLDARSKGEYDSGSIEGFVNIPVDELRGRISELDKSKPVYVTCAVGMRSYIATRILVHHGFDAYYLSGGMELYRVVML